MAENKITKDDLFEGGLFDDAKKGALALAAAIEKLNASFDDLKRAKESAENITFTNSQSLKDRKKAFEDGAKAEQDAIKLSKQLAASTDEEVRARVRLQLANQTQKRTLTEEVKLQSDLVGMYDKAQIRLNQMVKLFNELAFRGRENGKVARGLAADIKSLNDQFIKVDTSSGRFGRVVGNYKTGFNGLQNSINQVTRELPAFTNSIQTGFLAISNNLPILSDEIARTNAQIKQLRAEGQEVPGLFKQMTSSILSFGTALSVGITLLTVYGKDIVMWVEDLFNSSQRIDAITKEIDADLEKVVERTKELNSENKIAILEYLADTKKIKESSAERAIAQIKYTDEALKLLDNRRKEEKKINDKYNALAKISAAEQAAQQLVPGLSVAFTDRAIQANKAKQVEVLKNNEEYQKQLAALALKYNIEEIKTKKGHADKLKDLEKEIQQEVINQMKDGFDKQRAQVNFDAKFRLIELEKDFRARLLIESQYYKLVNELKKTRDIELAKIDKEQRDKLIKDNEDLYDELDTIEANNNKRILERNLALEDIRFEKQKRNAIENAEDTVDGKKRLDALLEGLEKDHLAKIASIQETERKRIQQENIDRVIKGNKEVETIIETDMWKRGKSGREIQKKLDEQRVYDLQQEIKVLEENEQSALDKRLELAKLERDIVKRQIQDNLAAIKQITDAVDAGLEERYQKQQKAADKELQLQQTAVQKQERLAEQGLENSLAFEERKLAEAELNKQQLLKKQQKQQEALKLAEIFLNSLNQKLGQNVAYPQASAEAFAETFIAKGITALIAGSFAEGVENFKGKGTGTSDSNLIAFSAGESVVTAKATAENPGLVTALNKGTFESEYLPNIMLGNMQLKQDSNKEDQVSVAIMTMVMNQFKSLEETVKNKREYNINWDSHDGRVEEIIDGKMKKVINHIKTGKPKL